MSPGTRRSNGQRRRPGFSLIELLVVITIIAILAGVLLGAVQQIKNASANTKCASNMRNLAMAIGAYAANQDGLLPYRDNNSEWWDRMPDELDGQYQGSYKQNRADVFHCPFADREIGTPWTFFSRFSAYYGMNDHVRVCWNPGPPGYWVSSQPPLLLANLPADLVLLADNRPWHNGTLVYFEGSVDYTVGGGPWQVSTGAPAGATRVPITMHGGSVNLCCMDGHVERVAGVWDQTAMQARFKTSASKR